MTLMVLLSGCGHTQYVSNPNPDAEFSTCEELDELLAVDNSGKEYCPRDKMKTCNALKRLTIPNLQLREVQNEKDRVSFASCRRAANGDGREAADIKPKRIR